MHTGVVSLLVGLTGHCLYCRSVVRGRSRPHAVSWSIWGILTAIAFRAQLSGGAGDGAWITGFTAASCCSIGLWAMLRDRDDITRAEWAAFAGALVTLGIWYFTCEPLTAVGLVVVIEAFAYWPTFRRSHRHPFAEMASTYALGALKYALGILAMRQRSLVTVLYPAFIVAANSAFVAMVMWRRERLLSQPMPARPYVRNTDFPSQRRRRYPC